MSAPRAAAWLFGLGSLGLVPLHAAQAVEEPQAVQPPAISAQQAIAGQPALASESETHAAPSVSISFDGKPATAADAVSPAETGPAPVPAQAAAAPEPAPTNPAMQATASAEPAPVKAADAPVQPDEPAKPEIAAVPATEPKPAEVAAPELPSAPVAITQGDAVAGALQQRIGSLLGGLPPRLPRHEREALASYYATAQFHPVWVAQGTWRPAAQAVIARLKQADEDGLDPADYPVPILGKSAASPSSEDPAELAEAELKLSAVATLYARDARGGRIDPTRLSALITPKLELPAADAVIARVAAAPDANAALEAYNPSYPGYLALKAKLAGIRANRPTPMVQAPSRHGHGAKLASLDGSVPTQRLEGDLIANMERWRWLPSEVGSRYIFVNIPQFKLELIEGGKVVHEARVITGKPDSPTPVFSGTMEYAVVNPSWYIPPSIMKREILPGLAADPDYAAKRGYEIVRKGGQIYVRQPPGERNALGFIKFMFPNQHAVYLHDTPNRRLFQASMRAFSHGCVRVDQPFALADFVLGKQWTEQRLKRLIGQGERTIRMPEKLPVHLAYFTTRVEASGELRSFGDLYGINRKVRLALGLGA